MTGSGSLRESDVVAVYREVLGREPGTDEVAHHLGTLGSLADLLRVALASSEYAARAGTTTTRGPRPTVANIHHPDLARWTYPPGTRSDDGIAVVGHDGWVFLSGGSNSVVDQFTGELQMDDDWLTSWQLVFERRRKDLAELSIPSAFLVVPDKLAVYEEAFPEPLPRRGPRPIERLLADPALPILYPLDALRAVSDDRPAFLRPDSHVSLRGNAVLFDAVRDVIAPSASVDIERWPVTEYLASGDLGSRYDPQIVAACETVGDLGGAEITEDNHDRMSAVGGHIGTRRVYANPTAADQRTVVLFGDSFGFGTAHYQGLAWFLAQVFREVHFVWVPFGWDRDYTERVGADVVVFEGAERFLARIPLLSVDALGLAEQTLSRKQGLDLAAAFRGVPAIPPTEE